MTTALLSPDQLRLQTTAYLARHGFRASGSLPLSEEDFGLRPRDEIVARLMALNVVFCWANAPEEHIATEAFWPYIERNALQPFLTKDERGVLALQREEAQDRYSKTSGWKLENMWPLAWILGFGPEPTIFGGKVSENISQPLIGDYLDYMERPREDMLSQSRLRDEADVLMMEDRFYAAHNAVRSAQLDPAAGTVPEGLDPLEQGGVIHERRHAFTWAVSPGVEWDDTDLSS